MEFSSDQITQSYLFDKGVWCQEERAVSDLVTAELHKENT